MIWGGLYSLGIVVVLVFVQDQAGATKWFLVRRRVCDWAVESGVTPGLLRGYIRDSLGQGLTSVIGNHWRCCSFPNGKAKPESQLSLNGTDVRPVLAFCSGDYSCDVLPSSSRFSFHLLVGVFAQHSGVCLRGEARLIPPAGLYDRWALTNYGYHHSLSAKILLNVPERCSVSSKPKRAGAGAEFSLSSERNQVLSLFGAYAGAAASLLINEYASMLEILGGGMQIYDVAFMAR